MTRLLRWLKSLWEDAEDTEATPHARSARERAHFWAEFRAGQREADKRMLEAPNRPEPEPVTR